MNAANAINSLNAGNAMDFSNLFVCLFLAGSLFSFALNLILETADFRHRKLHGTEIPAELKDAVDGSKLEQTVAYENAHYFLWLPQTVCSFVLSLALVFCGFYSWLYSALWAWTGNAFLTAFLFSAGASVPSAILSLPFDLYKEFKIEKRFGFSKMTFGLWLADFIKSLVISLIISAILLGAAVFLLKNASTWWWLLLGAVYVAFSLLASYVYPVLIMPLFNKFTPLPQGELKDRLEQLLLKTGFVAKNMFVMDASKRSGHSNAFFTGLGKNKRIVLYDTLIEQLTTDEIEATLGHELGHYKHHHILNKMLVMIPLIFAALFAAYCLVKLPELYSAFGFNVQAAGLDANSPVSAFFGIFLLGLVFEGFSPLASLVSNIFSRRDEYQADAFCARTCGNGEALISALIKLNKENLSEMVPQKTYALFNYSHPPLLERIRAIRKVSSEV